MATFGLSKSVRIDRLVRSLSLPERSAAFDRLALYVIDRVSTPEGMDGCWLWTGGLDSAGYAVVPIAGQFPVPGHRLMLALADGHCPGSGWFACHRCGVRRCVSPFHLYWGSPRENARDMVLQGRHISALRREALRREVGDSAFGVLLAQRKTARGGYLGPSACGRCVAAVRGSSADSAALAASPST